MFISVRKNQRLQRSWLMPKLFITTKRIWSENFRMKADNRVSLKESNEQKKFKGNFIVKKRVFLYNKNIRDGYGMRW